MLYEWIKILHILSSSILFGAGVVSVLYFIFLNQQNDVAFLAAEIKRVLFYGVLLTVSSGVIQFITGLLLIFLKYAVAVPIWLILSAIGYVVAVICWIFCVYFQMRCCDLACIALKKQTPLSAQYHRYYKLWCWFGVPAFIALLCVLYLMVNH